MIIPVKSQARSDLEIVFYANPDAAWSALLNDEIDMFQWSLAKGQKEVAETNPDIQLAKYDENGIFELDLNNNYTIQSYRGVRSPTNELKVRQAIARLIDKNYVITSILENFGVRIDQPICPSQSEWCNESVTGPNYPYEYNPEAAAVLFSSAGFRDLDGDGWLNYPADWDGAPNADTEDYPLVVCIRNDHNHRKLVGEYLISQLETTLASTSIGAGFKTTGLAWMQPRAILSPKIMGSRDYHVYTGCWSLGRFPTYLLSLFHSMFWYPYGSNYVTGVDKNGDPNYQRVDDATWSIWHASNLDSAVVASHSFCGLHAEYCINIPLWSYSSYLAYRKELVGVVNMNGYGIENTYTFLNAYRIDGGPIRFGVPSDPSRLNILYSQWRYEHAFLNRIYTSGLSVNPYELMIDQPWVVKDMEISTWVDPQDSKEKTIVTYYLRKDVAIVELSCGCPAGLFNASDFEFTIWYNYAFDDSWQWHNFMDVKYTRILDVNDDGWKELQVFFDEKSYWFYSSPTYPLMGPRRLLLDPLCALYAESWTQTGTNTHELAKKVVQVASANLDGLPLTEGVDYIIRAGYTLNSHIEFYPLRDLTGALSITYWYPDISASGFYLAGLPWQQTMYSLGTHYPVSMTNDPPDIGDKIALNRTKFFFLETPLLGEVDWAWEWVSSIKPRNGRYAIRIYDVVRATGAYSTRGDGTFNENFFPGADLDSSDLCHIGLFDVVNIVSKFGRTFGYEPG